MQRTIVISAAVLMAGGLGAWYWHAHRGPVEAFRTAEVQKGDLRVTISATGTIEPEEVVDVGAQVAGQIKSLGQDPTDSSKTIDYDTPVEQGTILARIDDTLYAADVEQAKAAVDAAVASQVRAEADLRQMKAKLVQAGNDFNRAKEISRTPGAMSAQDYDSFQAAHDTAQATVAVGEAAIVQAQRAVAQAQALLKKAQTNLDYCTIRSPVKGIIIDRRVNVGQTIVSALNAPSLFLIAKDLTRIQIWVSVNEADIGQIKPGQPVTFTTDAYKDTFNGVVNKIRLNATMTNNVVTYTVEINTDNLDGRLKPYLTANVRFLVGQYNNVLLVPSSALQWRPQPNQIAPEARDASDKGRKKSGKENSDVGTLWVQDGGYVRPIKVKLGASDGANTEIEGEGLEAGTKVVMGEVRANEGNGGANPFAPQMFRGAANKDKDKGGQ
jgi:HlyD family secretion protein